MLLRAQAIGERPSLRFVILRVDTDEELWWDGSGFTDNMREAVKYAHPSDACFEIQSILKEHYGQLPLHRFVVPVEIEVYGDVSKRDIAEYLFKSSVLSIRTEEFGNGPKESLVTPVIHWGYLKEIVGSVKEQIDDFVED